MDGWMGGWVGGWMDGWMGGWVDGWMDGWIDFAFYVQTIKYIIYNTVNIFKTYYKY